jgi:hypothetical protein
MQSEDLLSPHAKYTRLFARPLLYSLSGEAPFKDNRRSTLQWRRTD